MDFLKSWKNVASKLMLVIFAVVLFFSVQTNTYAATKLTAPEAGWKRYDDSNGTFVYLGENWIYQTATANLYNSTHHYSSQSKGGNEVRFKFYGTKMRLISSTGSTFANDISVIIDGVSQQFSAKAGTTTAERQQLTYEKTNLPLGIHEVKLISGTNGDWRLDIDAVDIDETGYLIASVGSQLNTPENGWTRVEAQDNKVALIGTGWVSGVYDGYSLSGTSNVGDTIVFSFYGSQLRILDTATTGRSSKVQISIDGGEPTIFSEYKSVKTFQTIVYENLALTPGVHTVEVKLTEQDMRMAFDAFEFVNNGYLIDAHVSEPSELKAVGKVGKVDLVWTEVPNAASYSIKRSTKAGGPYETIAKNVTQATYYTDADVIAGETYFYVVTASNNYIESGNSNEVSSIPLEQPETGSAILTIYLTNGIEKEYDLSMTEVNAFIHWFEQKDAGVGPAKYAFTKTWNMGPFTKRTEYIVFNKILTFNVDEYAADEE